MPPYLVKDGNTGKLSGINHDIMEMIGRNLGVKVNWTTEIGIGDVAAALNANKFDVMCQTLWPSAARYGVLTLTSRPQFYSAIYAVARADDDRFDGNLDRANHPAVKAIGAEGDFSLDLVNEKFPLAQKSIMPSTTSLAEYIMQLTTKKGDVLFMDKGSAGDYSKKNPGRIKLVPDIPPARIYGEHLAVKLGEYKLRDVLDMALLQLTNDGDIEKLVEKYAREYGAELYPPRKDIDED